MAIYRAVEGTAENFFNVQTGLTTVIQFDNHEVTFKSIPRRMKKQELDETFALNGAKLKPISVSEFEEMLKRVKQIIKISLNDQLKPIPRKPGFLDD